MSETINKPNSHCHFCGTWFPDEVIGTSEHKCAECGNTVYLNPIPVAVALVPIFRLGEKARDDSSGLLVIRRSIPPKAGEFALPGGYVAKGETWQEALVREVAEETGTLKIAPEKVTLFDCVSTPNGAQVLIFGETPSILPEQIKDFLPNAEASEAGGIWHPQNLAFPIHTDMAAKFFKKYGA